VLADQIIQNKKLERENITAKRKKKQEDTDDLMNFPNGMARRGSAWFGTVRFGLAR